MAFLDFIEKAKIVVKKWWKWILGGILAIVALLVLWKLRKQANKIAQLKAEVAKSKELAKDLEARAETEKNAETAKTLRDEAAKIAADVAVREADLAKREQETNEAIKKVEAAKTWDDLAARAKGDSK